MRRAVLHDSLSLLLTASGSRRDGGEEQIMGAEGFESGRR